MRRLLLVAGVLVAAAIVAGALPPALAQVPPPPDQVPPPPATTSLYVQTRSLEQEGCAHASTYARRRPHDALVVLDFGRTLVSQPGVRDWWGASLFGGPDSSVDQIRDAALGFARAYRRCLAAAASAGPVRTVVVLGTTNFGLDDYSDAVRREHGQRWAGLVVGANDQLAAEPGLPLRFAAGADLEPDWSRIGAAQAWLDGLLDGLRTNPLLPALGGPAAAFVYFGAASGCPQGSSADGPCNNGWRQSDVVRLAYAGGLGAAAPQIYTRSGSQARQWARLAELGAASGQRLWFAASLTQQGACQDVGGCTGTDNSPAAGWRQLTEELGPAYPVLAATDIRWRGLASGVQPVSFAFDPEVAALLATRGR